MQRQRRFPLDVGLHLWRLKLPYVGNYAQSPLDEDRVMNLFKNTWIATRKAEKALSIT